jgi:hypothetical protein
MEIDLPNFLALRHFPCLSEVVTFKKLALVAVVGFLPISQALASGGMPPGLLEVLAKVNSMNTSIRPLVSSTEDHCRVQADYTESDNLGAQSADALTPQAAVAMALSERLSLVGSIRFNPNDPESCVYHNSSVLVIMDYCHLAHAPATSILIATPDGRSVSFYVETSDTEPGSTDTPTVGNYPQSWAWDITYMRPASAPRSSPGLLAMDLHKVVKFENEAQNQNVACSISRFSHDASCDGQSPSLQNSWLKPAQRFWDQPNSAWFQLLEQLHSQNK